MINHYTVQQDIDRLLEQSTISAHEKDMLRILMPVMDDKKLKSVHNALRNEERERKKLEKKQNRLELKYDLMMKKLSKIEADLEDKVTDEQNQKSVD